MNRTKLVLSATLALGLSGAAHAEDNLPGRAVSALSAMIASQGNAALVQIRAELREELLEHLRPRLPQAPAPAPVRDPAPEPRQ